MFRRILGTVLILCVFAIGCMIWNFPRIYRQSVVQQQVSLPDRIEQVSNSVVHIMNETQSWQGSGVAIAKNIILTARHVIEGGVNFTITMNDGKEYKATEAILNKKYDLGFIKIDKPILEPAKFGSIEDCRLGQQVFVIGSPYGKLNFNSITLGVISGLNRNQDSINWNGESYGWEIAFTTDAAGHPGNSGCPIFTMDGKVRGILVGGFSPVLVICMPIDLIIFDLPLIDIMFRFDYYEFEKEQSWDSYEEYE